MVPSPVVFTTAFDAYAIRAFRANSIDYLLKPVKLAELQAALAKLRQWPGAEVGAHSAPGLSSLLTSPPPALNLPIERLLDALPRPDRPYKTRFLVRQGELLLPLPAAEIAWFTSRNDTTTLVAADGRRFLLDYTLEQLESLPDPAHFYRLNRQAVTQLSTLRRLHPYFNGKLLVELHPAASEEIMVSREKASAVKAWLEG